jgi:hypothetical protein
MLQRGAFHDFVRVQQVAGATAALAFVRAHHPRIDLWTVGKGLPRTSDDEGWPMMPHYDVALSQPRISPELLKLILTGSAIVEKSRHFLCNFVTCKP